jgi:hypothetical protein
MSSLLAIEFSWARTWVPQLAHRMRARVQRQAAGVVGAGAEVGQPLMGLSLAQGRDATMVRAQHLCLGAPAQGQFLRHRSWCAAATLAKRVASALPCSFLRPDPNCPTLSFTSLLTVSLSVPCRYQSRDEAAALVGVARLRSRAARRSAARRSAA